MKTTCLFISLLLLTACGGNAGAPTAEENIQLDDAANLLNQAPANLDSVDDSGLASANGQVNETP